MIKKYDIHVDSFLEGLANSHKININKLPPIIPLSGSTILFKEDSEKIKTNQADTDDLLSKGHDLLASSEVILNLGE